MGQDTHPPFKGLNAFGPCGTPSSYRTLPQEGGLGVRSENGIEGRAESIRVLVVDDYDLYRTGLATLLAARPGIEVIGQASNGRSGVRLAQEMRPDVVLMDLQMPDISGHEATRAIRADRPEARVVILTVSSEDSDVETAVQAGACGYLAKDTPMDEVVAATRERYVEAYERLTGLRFADWPG